MSIYYGDEPSFRGYMPMGVENTEGQIDGREQVEFAAEYGKWTRKSSVNNNVVKEHFYHRLRVMRIRGLVLFNLAYVLRS